jgi:hypothetical protein
MSNRSFWIVIASAASAGLISLALAAEPRGFEVVSRAPDPLDLRLLDRLDTRLSRQLRAAGIRIREGADPDVVEGLYAAGYHGRNDPWNDILQVSRPDNPLITDACRERALARVLDNAADRESVAEHLREQVDVWRQVRQGARHLRLSEILLHLADCREGCGAYLSGILSCHIDGVRSRPRTIVYFDAGRPREDEERYFVFSRRDERRISELARAALAEGRDVILLSRAAGAGAFDRNNLSGNNALAWRRARVVDNLLIAAGVPRDRIRWKILSWETPRLAASDVARGYGFLDDWQSMQDKRDMDRSVVLVAD